MSTATDSHYLNPKPLSLWDKLKYTLTLYYNKLRYPAKNEILSKLYLGRIPEAINQLPADIKMIVSVVEYGELEIVNFPFEILQQKNINHVLVSMKDFDSEVSAVRALEAIGAMHLAKGGIYIHCKAGRARSAMILALLLAFAASDISHNPALKEASEYHKYAEFIKYAEAYNKENFFQTAMDFIRTKRPHIIINENKIKTALAIMAEFETITLQEASHIYMTNKNELSRTLAFKASLLRELKKKHAS